MTELADLFTRVPRSFVSGSAAEGRLSRWICRPREKEKSNENE